MVACFFFNIWMINKIINLNELYIESINNFYEEIDCSKMEEMEDEVRSIWTDSTIMLIYVVCSIVVNLTCSIILMSILSD